jgi:eukaryotic-like serine/threonine-protein kinase
VEQVIADRYRLGPTLGAGGMARVVAAHDLRLDRQVAIKLVPVAGIDRAGRERFVREARSSAGFSHPDAVAVYDAGEADGYLYLVMELVDGTSLAGRLADEGALDVDEALRITGHVLAALGAAHRAGIVHRDVKPGNVLLGRSGEVKLADFGIAKRLGDMSADLTGSGRFVGTPKYLAPEQVAGRAATPATDLYAVGVVLYEMLTGRPPYDFGDPMAIAIAHRDAPIPDLHGARSAVPDPVAAAVKGAMAKDPAERFASAEQMAAALDAPVGATIASPASDVLPPSVLGSRPEPTQVMVGPVRPKRRAKSWWWAAAAGLAVGGGIALAISQRDEEPNVSARTAGTGSQSPASTAAATSLAPTTTAAPTTTTTTTTVPPTAAPTLPPAPESIEELIALLEADLGRFGPQAPDFLEELREILEENGREQADRAEELLSQTDDWVSSGQLSPELAPLAEGLLVPIADGPGNDDNDNDKDNSGPGKGGDD